MKRTLFFLLALSSSFYAGASRAETQLLWTCHSSEIPEVRISRVNGKLVGTASWNCDPKGKPCTVSSEVTFRETEEMDALYQKIGSGLYNPFDLMILPLDSFSINGGRSGQFFIFDESRKEAENNPVSTMMDCTAEKH